MHRFILPLLALSALAACSAPPNSAYYNRGGPEALLDVSSEVVNLSVAGPNELSQLQSWIEQDQPSRAELYCPTSEPRCIEARKVLELNGVPTMAVPSMDYAVALVYERILARDCNQRFRDDGANNFNTPHAALGCSMSANIVQHVSDKQQFINPNLMDVPPATQAVHAHERAYAPPAIESGGIMDSLVEGASTN